MADQEKKEEQDEEAGPLKTMEELKVERSYLQGASAAEHEEDSAPLWLITFTDVMALMLTFFVLLYSMSVPDAEKWEDLKDRVSQGLSKYTSAQWSAGPKDTINIDKLNFNRALDLHYLKALIEKTMLENDRLSGLIMIPQKDRLVLSLPSELLFEGGQTEVSTNGKRALFAIGGPLARIRNRIEIIGHADPRPMKSEQYPNNWSLSLARAVSVSAVLDNVGYQKPVIVRGLSSARYYDLPETMSEEERLKLARRVDIVIMEDDGTRNMVFSSDVF